MNTKRSTLLAGSAVAALAFILLVFILLGPQGHDPWTGKPHGPPIYSFFSLVTIALNALYFNRATFVIALLLALPMLALWPIAIIVFAKSPNHALNLDAKHWLIVAVYLFWPVYAVWRLRQPRQSPDPT